MQIDYFFHINDGRGIKTIDFANIWKLTCVSFQRPVMRQTTRILIGRQCGNVQEDICMPTLKQLEMCWWFIVHSSLHWLMSQSIIKKRYKNINQVCLLIIYDLIFIRYFNKVSAYFLKHFFVVFLIAFEIVTLFLINKLFTIRC